MELSNIINIVIVLTLLVLTLGFLFYKKIVNVSLLFIKILFPFSILVALSTLFLPQLYSSFVDNNFSTTILAQDLKSVDKTLTQVSKVQIDFQNSLNTFLNTGSTKIDAYQSNLYNQVTDFMIGTLRIVVLLISLLVLVFALYIRYTFAGSFEALSLQKQIDELKKEVKLLKQTGPKVY